VSNRLMTKSAVGVSLVVVLAATTGLVAADNAVAAGRCKSTVTTMTAVSKSKFAGGGLLRRYSAAVDYPNGATVNWEDQSANLIYGVYPAGTGIAVINARIGETKAIGSMVQTQRPTAMAAINGDFYTQPVIRTKTMEIPHGPIVRDGQIIRADFEQDRAVGVDTSGAPFGGMLAVSGTVKAPHVKLTDVMGVNWEKVQPGGVSIYSPDWSSFTSSPRPAGVAEWVLNKKNVITEVRTAGSTKLGTAVAANTRVIAFPTKLATRAAAGVVGVRVKVNLAQSTDTGVVLSQAVGRNLPLVQAGVAAPLGCAAYANDGQRAGRPRTVIGWTKTGQWRTLIIPGATLNGSDRNGGFGLSNEAAVAKKLGMYYAYELDGGGSTTLYTRSDANVWSRRDLWGVTGGTYERPVSDGLAFMAPPTSP
jgi:hypothetical protein